MSEKEESKTPEELTPQKKRRRLEKAVPVLRSMRAEDVYTLLFRGRTDLQLTTEAILGIEQHHQAIRKHLSGVLQRLPGRITIRQVLQHYEENVSDIIKLLRSMTTSNRETTTLRKIVEVEWFKR